MNNEKSVSVKQWLTSSLLGCVIDSIPFVIVGMLFEEFLSVNRMILAYAISILSRQGIRLMLTMRQKVSAMTAACLMLVGAIVCAGCVAWRSQHWALCGCGLPVDEIIPARFYISPMIAAVILMATSYGCEYAAIRGKYKRITKCCFYIACTAMAWFALNFVEA